MTKDCLFIGGPWNKLTRRVEILSYYDVYKPTVFNATEYENEAPQGPDHLEIVRYRLVRVDSELCYGYFYVAEDISSGSVFRCIREALLKGDWT